MNRLQKRAWNELAGMVVCVIISGLCFSLMVKLNSKGVGLILIFLVSGGIAGLVSAIMNIKSLKKYDERERHIYHHAFVVSTFAFVGFIMCFVVITFFGVGGGGTIAVGILPVMLLGGLFVGQAVQSGVILFKCAMEEDDE